MKPTTFDILDKHLEEERDKLLKGHAQSVHRTYKKDLIINPLYWNDYYPLLNKYSFTWTEFKYQDVATKAVDFDTVVTTTSTGVYLFIVKAKNLIADCPKYVIYVGIAGENDSRRSLKERLIEYFSLSGIKKRHKVHTFLYEYYEDVYINYSPMNLPPDELCEIEENLHGFFCPPANERDYPIGIKKLIKAW